MNRNLILPKLTILGLKNNMMLYLPFIVTASFGVAIHFIFNGIILNPIMRQVPYAEYAIMLLEIGKVLLSVILICFLFYANSFLIKRRKRELGVYTILGLEKKHVVRMLFLESVILYIIAVVAGCITGTVFSKLLFLLLLKMCNLSSDVQFVIKKEALFDTSKLFFIIFTINFLANIFGVSRLQPTEMVHADKKGEKEPKHLLFKMLLGILLLVSGYTLSIISKIDSWIFLFFFLAVLLVIPGTYLVFTSGIIWFLKYIKGKQDVYYSKTYFITISGMLYRMKKSAAGLVNICLFSTMLIITVMCTLAVSFGEKGTIAFSNPYDVQFIMTPKDTDGIEDNTCEQELMLQLSELAAKYHVSIKDSISFCYGDMEERKEGITFEVDDEPYIQENQYTVRFLTAATYNMLQNKQVSLSSGEIVIYSTFLPYENDRMIINGNEYHVVDEVRELKIDRTQEHSMSNQVYYVVMKDFDEIKKNTDNVLYSTLRFNLDGTEDDIRLFLKDAQQAYEATGRSYDWQNIWEYGDRVKALDGALLFLGLFFGLMFAASLVLIMYYKQITEGLEDQDSFRIMKKVGMGEEDIACTIRRQILLVFAIPAVMAVIHLIAAFKILLNFLYVLNLFETEKSVLACVIVVICYGVFYVGCYLVTARTYYKIVK